MSARGGGMSYLPNGFDSFVEDRGGLSGFWKREGNALRIQGIDYGPKGLEILLEDKVGWLVRIPGHKAWAGNGGVPWRYVPTRHAIFDKMQEGRALHVISYAFGRKSTKIEELKAWFCRRCAV